MRRLFPILLLAALCWPAAAAPRRPRQIVTFEAPRELLSASSRDATLDQITGFGVTHVRQLVYWRDYAPDPDSKTKPSFDASDPNAYPADKWDNLDGLIAAAKAKSVAGHADAHRPGPEVGDQEQEGQPHRPGPEGVRRVRDRDRPPLRRRREHLVDLERAQPAAVPQAAVQERQAGVAEALPQALPGGLRRPALDAGQRRRHDPDRRDLAARQLERRAPARVPARDAVPGLQVPQVEVLRRARGRRLRPPRVHDQRRARASSRPTPTT